MVFGWGKKNDQEEEDDDDDDEEIELVLFQGALNGVQPNMKENARLVSAGNSITFLRQTRFPYPSPRSRTPHTRR